MNERYDDGQYSTGTPAMVWYGPFERPYLQYVPPHHEPPPKVYEDAAKETVRGQVKERVIERVIERTIEKERPVTVVIQQQPIERREGMSITSISGILVIMLVCIVTVKWVLPRLTVRYAVFSFVGLFWKPGKRKAAEVRKAWEEANAEGGKRGRKAV